MSIEWSLIESSVVRETASFTTLSGHRMERWVRLTWEVRVEHGVCGRPWWRVWARARELPEATVGLDHDHFKALGLARARARQLEEVLGGRILDGQLVVERVG